MVEKQIEFYFSKHPLTELDCGWSRKGSSNYERSLIMANNKKLNRQETPRIATVACCYTPDLYATALRIQRALDKGLIYVKVHFEYVIRTDSSFDPDEWSSAAIDFEEFESLINYLLYEFKCVDLKDYIPMQRRHCFHMVDVVFTKGGTI